MPREIGDTILQAAQSIVQQNQNAAQLQFQALQLGEQLRSAERSIQLREANLELSQRQIELATKNAELASQKLKAGVETERLMNQSLVDLGVPQALITELGVEGTENFRLLDLVSRLKMGQLAIEQRKAEIQKLSLGEPVRQSERRRMSEFVTNHGIIQLTGQASEDPEQFGFPKELVAPGEGILDTASIQSNIRNEERQLLALQLTQEQSEQTLKAIDTKSKAGAELLQSLSTLEPQIELIQGRVKMWRQYLAARQNLEREAAFNPEVRRTVAQSIGVDPRLQTELDLAHTRDPEKGSNQANVRAFVGMERSFEPGTFPEVVLQLRGMAEKLMNPRSTNEDIQEAIQFFVQQGSQSALTDQDVGPMIRGLTAILLEFGDADRIRSLNLSDRIIVPILTRNRRGAARTASTQRAVKAAQNPPAQVPNVGNEQRERIQKVQGTR